MKPDDLKLGAAVWVFARQWYRGIVVRLYPATHRMARTADVSFADDSGRPRRIRKELSELMGADAYDRDPDRENGITLEVARATAAAYWSTKK